MMVRSGEGAANCTDTCGVHGQLPENWIRDTGVEPPAGVLSPDLNLSSPFFLQSLRLCSALEKDFDTFQNKVERNLQRRERISLKECKRKCIIYFFEKEKRGALSQLLSESFQTL